MSGDASDIDARLRTAARLSSLSWSTDKAIADMARRAREARRSAVVSMEPADVDARLREVASLSRLCRSLSTPGTRSGS